MYQLIDGGVNHPGRLLAHAVDIGNNNRNEFNTVELCDRLSHQVRRQLTGTVDVPAGRLNIIRLKIFIGFHLVDAGGINHTLTADLTAQLNVITRQLHIVQLHRVVRPGRAGGSHPCQVEEAAILLLGDFLRQSRYLLIQHIHTGNTVILCQHIVKADIQCHHIIALFQQSVHQRFADKPIRSRYDHILHLYSPVFIKTSICRSIQPRTSPPLSQHLLHSTTISMAVSRFQ